MKLFQYWDTGQPPQDVAGWIEGFRTDNPWLEHRFFDRESASRFIRNRLGKREQRAFDACAVPAMQADYFRLAALWVHGGIYMDADFQPHERLWTLVKRLPHSMMLVFDNRITNGFIVSREAGNPFIGACLDLATANIEARRFDSPFDATGPALINALWALLAPEQSAGAPENPLARGWDAPDVLALARDLIEVTPELVASFRAMTLLHLLAAERWLTFERAAYKDTPRHWVNWQGSIYRDGPELAEA
ncbi:MAG TPA: glycosyltransferase [Caulobacteraceae bacterium]